MNDDDELHLGDYLEILRRRWLTIAIAVVLVVGAAVALSARTEARYRAEARVSVSTTAAQDRLDPSSGSTNAQTLQRRLENELELARSDDVEQAAEAAVGGSFDASVRADSDSDTLVFSATALSADEAAERANAYAAAFVAERTSSTADELDAATATLNARLADIEAERDDILEQIDDGADERRFSAQLAALDSEEATLRSSLREIKIAEDLAAAGSATVTRAATPPSAPFEPAWSRNVALALVVGLVLGVGAALLRETLDGTIRTKDALEAATGRPTLGLLPKPGPGKAADRPVLVTASAGAFVEGMRSLRSSLLFARDDAKTSVFAFTSPSPAEGKTTTVVNLALSLARAGHSVVLVDADLRRPRAGEACGVDLHAPGLADALTGRTGLQLHSEQVTGEQLFEVLPAGIDVPDPAEVLASPGFQALVDHLRSMFEIVVLDTAPVLPVADALAVAAAADATVVVARSGETNAKQAEAAMELLERADADVIGTVLTDADERSGYGRYGAYGYGGGSRAKG